MCACVCVCVCGHSQSSPQPQLQQTSSRRKSKRVTPWILLVDMKKDRGISCVLCERVRECIYRHGNLAFDVKQQGTLGSVSMVVPPLGSLKTQVMDGTSTTTAMAVSMRSHNIVLMMIRLYFSHLASPLPVTSFPHSLCFNYYYDYSLSRTLKGSVIVTEDKHVR